MDVVVIVLGIIGVFIAFLNLPGQWLVFIASLIAFLTGNSDLNIWIIVAYLALTIVASVTDNLFMLWGTKRYGGTGWGMLGAFVGLIVGALIGNFFGAIVGPFLGAYLFESYFAKKDSDAAFRAGIGTMIGLGGGILVKVIITGFMFITLLLIIR